jgi:hypothetical protein
MHYDFRSDEVDERGPLIYMWEIRDPHGKLVGRYVGKAKAGANRPRTHYARNVANVLAHKPYRKSNPNGYRRIHLALALAQTSQSAITLTFLCNPKPGENINDAERRCIKEQNSHGTEAWQLNG